MVRHRQDREGKRRKGQYTVQSGAVQADKADSEGRIAEYVLDEMDRGLALTRRYNAIDARPAFSRCRPIVRSICAMKPKIWGTSACIQYAIQDADVEEWDGGG